MSECTLSDIENKLSKVKDQIVHQKWHYDEKDNFFRVVTLFNVDLGCATKSEKRFVKHVYETLKIKEIESLGPLGQSWGHWCIINDTICILIELLARGYNVNKLNSKKETLLDLAKKLKKENFIALLRLNGAMTNEQLMSK